MVVYDHAVDQALGNASVVVLIVIRVFYVMIVSWMNVLYDWIRAFMTTCPPSVGLRI